MLRRATDIHLLCCTLFVLLSTSNSWCQDSELKGVVQDAANSQAIAGTDVRVENGQGTVVGKSITNADGQYRITGLKRNSRVTTYYSRGGYVPHPRGPEEVLLSSASNTKNVQLLRDTSEAVYWVQWSTKVKTAVDASTSDKGQRLEQYKDVWSWLGASGLSAPAQGQAARGFVAIAPDLLRSTEIESFASVDLDSLDKGDADIRAAVNGQAKLSNRYSLPPDVAASIAANELNKRKNSDAATKLQFSNEFKSVWGSSGEQELQFKLSHSRQISNDSALDKSLGLAWVKPK
jgi:hypothetical protein